MRALGPGSVSSFLKTVLDVVHIALWFGLVAAILLIFIAVVVGFNPALLGELHVNLPGLEAPERWPLVVGRLTAFSIYLFGILVIVRQWQGIFATLMAKDPFDPVNVTHLRIIALALAGIEIGRYAVFVARAVLRPGGHGLQPGLSLTAWFSVLVVFVLAEVFREGSRLRREAELTI